VNVELVWITPEAERHIAYCARVSNPANQDNPDIARLLRYCIKNRHWSVFETASMCLGVVTSRAISAQMTRHWSFRFQEFSQRYAEVQAFEPVTPRRQDYKNRQNSFDDLPEEDRRWFQEQYDDVVTRAQTVYAEGLRRDISKESMRFLLPLCAQTTLYIVGNVRSWIHYLQARQDPTAQAEHREIADAAATIFAREMPTIWAALESSQP
jgi:thymidylate synthase (FAD)